MAWLIVLISLLVAFPPQASKAVCVIPSIANGFVNKGGSRIDSGRSVESWTRIDMLCNPGFQTTVGTNKAICLDDGRWHVIERPRFFPVCRAIQANSVQGPTCPADDPTFVPDNSFNFDYIPSPRLYESFLQIFENREISCHGVLAGFKFYATSEHVHGVYLCIFRPVGNEEYKLIGRTYINNYTLPEYEAVNSWVTIPALPPIQVHKGDLLGVYYDNLLASHDKIAISSDMQFDLQNTRVLRLDSSSNLLAVGKTLKIGLDNGAVYIGRYPLLTAVLSGASIA